MLNLPHDPNKTLMHVKYLERIEDKSCEFSDPPGFLEQTNERTPFVRRMTTSRSRPGGSILKNLILGSLKRNLQTVI